jgi:hypothetical protein
MAGAAIHADTSTDTRSGDVANPGAGSQKQAGQGKGSECGVECSATHNHRTAFPEYLHGTLTVNVIGTDKWHIRACGNGTASLVLQLFCVGAVAGIATVTMTSFRTKGTSFV